MSYFSPHSSPLGDLPLSWWGELEETFCKKKNGEMRKCNAFDFSIKKRFKLSK